MFYRYMWKIQDCQTHKISGNTGFFFRKTLYPIIFLDCTDPYRYYYYYTVLQADYKSTSITGLTQTSFPVCENFSVDWRYET